MRTAVLTTLFIGFLGLLGANAQGNFEKALGLRLGVPVSVSYKQFINDSDAIEAYLGFRGYGFGSTTNLSGAYQVHGVLASEVPELNWYFGGGASIFLWNYDNDADFASSSFALQGYLGLDYTFSDVPINLSIDWVPTFFLGGRLNVNSFGSGFGSIGVRYVLSR